MIKEFLKDKRNKNGIIRLLSLARMASLSLKIKNKIGAVIIDLDTKETAIGWNYAKKSSLETYKNGKSCYILLTKLYDTDDDLVTNHKNIIHAEQAALELFFEYFKYKEIGEAKDSLACFVSREPCKACRELLAKYNINYVVYPEDAQQTNPADAHWFVMHLDSNYQPSVLSNFQEVLCF